MSTLPEIHTRLVQVGGLNIHLYSAGEENAETLVLLHGGGVDSAAITWGEVIAPLGQHFRVLAPDLPGYGRSDKPDILYSMDFYIDFLREFLQVVQAPRPALAGLSLGGGIALGFALAHPGQARKLALVDSYGILSTIPYHRLSYLYVMTPLNEFTYWLLRQNREWVRQSLAASVYDPQNITPELLEDVWQILQDPAAGKAFTSFQRHELRWNGLRSDFTGRLGELRVPTLLLHGDLDSSVPPRWARQAQAAIAGSQLRLLKNRRHWALRDGPEEIVEILKAFLAAPE